MTVTVYVLCGFSRSVGAFRWPSGRARGTGTVRQPSAFLAAGVEVVPVALAVDVVALLELEPPQPASPTASATMMDALRIEAEAKHNPPR
jgi:hypothetical protein